MAAGGAVLAIIAWVAFVALETIAFVLFVESIRPADSGYGVHGDVVELPAAAKSGGVRRKSAATGVAQGEIAPHKAGK